MRKSAANIRDCRLLGFPATGSTGENSTRACSRSVTVAPALASPRSQSSKDSSTASREIPSKLTSMPAAGISKRSVVEPASKLIRAETPRMSSCAPTAEVSGM